MFFSELFKFLYITIRNVSVKIVLMIILQIRFD